MMEESFDWEVSAGSVLPNLQALTLIAAEPQTHSMTGEAITYAAGSRHIEDLYVQTLPGETPQPHK